MAGNIKTAVAMLMVISMITLVSSANPSFGIFKQNDCFEIKQICFINGTQCSFCNITSIDYPNGTRAVSNLVMTKRSGDFNYSYCNSEILGNYNVNGYCTYGTDVTKPWTAFFEITGTGFEFNQSRSFFYIGLIILLIFLLLITVFGIYVLPSKDETDDFGLLISISKLKYLRSILFVVAWGFLLSIVYTSSNIALAYLGSEMFGQLLWSIYQMMFWLTLPGVFIWFLFIFVQIFRDRETKRLLDRGIDVGGTP